MTRATERERQRAKEAARLSPSGFSLIDLDDAQMRGDIIRIFRVCLKALDANDPRETHEGKAAGKPSSRPPGRQHAPGLVKHVRNVVRSCADTLERAYEQSRVTEQQAQVIEAIGGFVLAVKEGSGGKALVAKRRKRDE